MKKFITSSFCLLLVTNMLSAQSVSVGNTNPKPSAILDLTNAQNKGLLIPSMTTSQKNGINAPANGLLVYQTDSAKGFYFYDGSLWRRTGEGGNAWMENDSAVYTNKKVGVGTAAPIASLHSKGSFLVEGNYIKGKQTGNIPVYNITNIEVYDSSGVLYDDGGPTGNYSNSLNLSFNINQYSSSGLIINIDSLDLLIGDTLKIIGGYYQAGDFLYDTLIVTGNKSVSKRFRPGRVLVKFKTNTTAVAAGFKIRWNVLYPGNSGNIKFEEFPFGLAYNDSLNSFSMGMIEGNTQGKYSFSQGLSQSGGFASVAMGQSIANGENSLAIGEAEAYGLGAVALGRSASAIGINSLSIGSSYAAKAYDIAIGQGSNALGGNSFALNFGLARGAGSVALTHSEAYGDYSTALNYGESIGTRSLSLGGSARGNFSTAASYSTVATGFNSFVVGTYNDSLVSAQTAITINTPLFIIGNGDNDANRNNAMVVLKSGFTGIGTNTPRTNLHVANGTDASYTNESGYAILGSVGSSNLVFDNNEILARNNGLASNLYLQNTGGNVGIGMGLTATPLTHQLQLSLNDAAKPTSSVWTIASDARLKTNVHDYTDGLKELLKIHPVWFTYTGEAGMPKETGVGILAQELQKISPYMVNTWNYKDEKGNQKDYLGVDNGAMTYMLINAVKEQQEQIALQQKILEQVIKQNEILLEKNKLLFNRIELLEKNK